MIHPTAIIADGAIIGDGVTIGPYCVIGPKVRIGDAACIDNGVTITGNVTMGRENHIFPYAVIGGPPQDFKYAGGDTRIVIGDRNIIREFVTINCGTEKGGGVTTVGSGNFLMTACHVAHDCSVGDSCIISNASLLAGHVTLGDCAVLSGAVALHHFVTVGEYAFIGGLSRIVRDVPPFLVTEGNPAEARTANIVGLRRNGFSEEAVSQIEAACKMLFRSDEPMSQTLSKLEKESAGPDVARLVAFMRARSAGKHGRARQP